VTGIINQDKYPSSATVLDVFNIADSDEPGYNGMMPPGIPG
jgi:hypothetical protein